MCILVSAGVREKSGSRRLFTRKSDFRRLLSVSKIFRRLGFPGSNKNYSHLRTPITSFIPAILLVGTNTSILLFLTKTFSATAAEVSLCCVQVTCLIIPKASIDLSSFKDSILPNARGFLTTPQNSKTFVVGLYKYKYIPMI